jgi:hypothetical protein
MMTGNANQTTLGILSGVVIRAFNEEQSFGCLATMPKSLEDRFNFDERKGAQ